MKLHRVTALVLTLGVLGVFCVTALTTSYDPQVNMCSYIECTDSEKEAAPVTQQTLFPVILRESTFVTI